MHETHEIGFVDFVIPKQVHDSRPPRVLGDRFVPVIDSGSMTREIQPAGRGSSRILVVRVGALGDTLMVTPLLRHLRARQPETELDFLCSGPAAPLLELNPHVSKLFPLRGRNVPWFLSIEKRRLVDRLRARNYDLAVLLESAPRYRLLLERARLRRIRSFEETAFDPALHAIVNNLRVAGIGGVEPDDLDMDLSLGPDVERAAARLLEGLAGPRIGVHIGWGPQGRKKNQSQRLRGWSLANFVQLIRRILIYSEAGVVLTGSAEDARDTEILCRTTAGGRVRSIAGKTKVRELASVIKSLDLLISVDSGPCHMAAALGTPLVVLWGPGRLEQTRPVSSFTPIRVLRHAVPCAPCQSTPLQKTCRRNLCMERITPEEVIAAAQSLLPSLTPKT